MRRSRLTALTLGALMPLLPQCVTRTQGIEVDVAYRPAATPAALQTGTGYRVRLERALIVFGEVELMRCDNFARALWNFLGPQKARAHAPTTPTRLGAPLVIDLMESSGVPVFAGTLRPPPGRYCGLRAVGAPAGRDAMGSSDPDMLETTLLLQGRLEQGNGIDMGPIDLRIGDRLEWELSFGEPLLLDEARSIAVAVVLDQTAWLDGVDFAPQDETAVRSKLLENVGSYMEASL